jgi:exodeoxyribonuclease VII large subunit
LDDWDERLGNALKAGLRERRSRIPQRLPRPDRVLSDGKRRLDRGVEGLVRVTRSKITLNRHRLENQAKLLESVSYQRVLDRGFALITTPAGAPVTSVNDLTPGADVTIRLKDGEGAARVAGSGPARAKPKRVKASGGDSDDPQGSLL